MTPAQAAPTAEVPPTVNGNGTSPDTKEDFSIKAGKAEKMVDKALEKVKDMVDGLDVAIKGIKADDKATLAPVAQQGEEVMKILKVSTVQIERAGQTDVKGAFKIKETSEGLFVSLNAVADDLIEKKPAITEAGLGMAVVKMLMEQKDSADAMTAAVIGSLPSFIQKEAKSQIEKKGNPIDRVIKEYSVGEMPPAAAPAESPGEFTQVPRPTITELPAELTPLPKPAPTTMASVALPPLPPVSIVTVTATTISIAVTPVPVMPSTVSIAVPPQAPMSSTKPAAPIVAPKRMVVVRWDLMTGTGGGRPA